MNYAQILTLDIETAPIESYHWRLWDENISIDQVNVEWSILSYCAKWLDSKKLIYRDTGGKGVKNVRNDKPLLKDLWALLDEADLVVAQNGNSFDMKKINARMAMHNMKPYSPVRTIDTWRAAKKYFGFTSNKLQWMAQNLTDTPKSPHKKFPGFELWAEVLKDNPEAWREMEKYNKRDVVATEKVYLLMRPWLADHPNLGMYDSGEHPNCPKCGSEHLQAGGYRTTQQGRYLRYVCQECGGWSRGKQMTVTAGMRRAKLAPC